MGWFFLKIYPISHLNYLKMFSSIWMIYNSHIINVLNNDHWSMYNKNMVWGFVLFFSWITGQVPFFYAQISKFLKLVRPPCLNWHSSKAVTVTPFFFIFDFYAVRTSKIQILRKFYNICRTGWDTLSSYCHLIPYRVQR